MDFGDHGGFIIAAYVVSAAVLAGLTVPKAVSPAERRPYQLA